MQQPDSVGIRKSAPCDTALSLLETDLQERSRREELLAASRAQPNRGKCGSRTLPGGTAQPIKASHRHSRHGKRAEDDVALTSRTAVTPALGLQPRHRLCAEAAEVGQRGDFSSLPVTCICCVRSFPKGRPSVQGFPLGWTEGARTYLLPFKHGGQGARPSGQLVGHRALRGRSHPGPWGPGD